MKQYFYTIPIMCLFLLLILSCTTQKHEKPQQEQIEYITKNMVVQLGSTITLELPSNRTTGFSWKIESFDNDYIAVLDHAYHTQDGDPKLMGKGGLETWKLKTLKKGITNITLSYRQQWRTDTHGQLATITITIT